MTRSLAQRAAARLRKQRQRDRDRQNARTAAAALAARKEASDEAVAEDLAPAIMRHAITTPDGRMLTGPRVRIVNGRPERCDPIANARNPEFTTVRKWAARQFQHDWNDVGAGVGVAAVDYLRSGGGGEGGGHLALLAQIEARRRLEGAMAALACFAEGVCRVVLDCVPISVWVLEYDPPSTLAAGVAWIALGLDRLVVFYDPPSPAKRPVIRTVGPARADYETKVERESVF